MPKVVDLQDEIVAALHEADAAIDALYTQLEQMKCLASHSDTGPGQALKEGENAAATVQGVLRKIKLADKSVTTQRKTEPQKAPFFV